MSTIDNCCGCGRLVGRIVSPHSGPSAMACDSIECARLHAVRVTWLLGIASATLRARTSPGEIAMTRDIAMAVRGIRS